jgi:16S rRNA (cytidine1402-2'-O)-methyltransferase
VAGDAAEGARWSDPPGGAAARPGLVLVATPIGNLADLSPRALAALRDADAVLCEDSRVTGGLLSRQGVAATMIPLHDHNEAAQAPRLVERMTAGERFALVSDAGTPLVSDPGYRLVRAAIDAGVAISAIPGPNAAVMALSLSGLPPHPFLFLGFLPARDGPRAAEVTRLRQLERAGLTATLVFYEAPHRLADTLAALAEGLGADRPAAVARELTKLFEEVRRDTLGALATHYASTEARGEICIVVGPAPPEQTDAADLDTALRTAFAAGLSLRDAAASVAEATGLKRRDVYRRALELGGEVG